MIKHFAEKKLWKKADLKKAIYKEYEDEKADVNEKDINKFI